MSNQSNSRPLTAPARPKSRISARPMTNGGVMIGSTLITRSAPLKRNAVRAAISAKARPRTVEPAPTTMARNTVFQATPQRRLEYRQSRPQIERSKKLAKNRPPSNALPSMTKIGKNTNAAMVATTSPIALTTNASPRQKPRAASPRQNSIRNPVATEQRAVAHARLGRPAGRRDVRVAEQESLRAGSGQDSGIRRAARMRSGARGAPRSATISGRNSASSHGLPRNAVQQRRRAPPSTLDRVPRQQRRALPPWQRSRLLG